jgi:SAM-dependent methyltransferase
MDGDREIWDERWRAAGAAAPVDPFVERALERLGGAAGRSALDLAAGAGRHALRLAELGWRTFAWDVSPAGLARLAESARLRGLVLATRAVDLLPAGACRLDARFDLVVVVDFLDRPLFQRLGELVAPRGHLVLCTFTEAWPGARPPARFRLAPGELAQGVAGFSCIEQVETGGRAGFLGVRASRIGDSR